MRFLSYNCQLVVPSSRALSELTCMVISMGVSSFAQVAQVSRRYLYCGGFHDQEGLIQDLVIHPPHRLLLTNKAC